MINGNPAISETDARITSKIEFHFNNAAQVKSESAQVIVHGPVGSVETVSGNVSTERDITGSVSTVSGNITAGGDITGDATSVSGDVVESKKKKRRREDQKHRAAPKRKRQRRRAPVQNDPVAEFFADPIFMPAFLGPFLQETKSAVASNSGGGDGGSAGVTTTVVDKMEGDCPICFEALRRPGNEVRILQCFHKFCEPCFSKWNKECPVCRST
jgi:hypothetical protein